MTTALPFSPRQSYPRASAVRALPPGSPGLSGEKNRRVVSDRDLIRIERELNRISATAIERRATALVLRVNGPASALRVIAAFRDHHPADQQLTIWPIPGQSTTRRNHI